MTTENDSGGSIKYGGNSFNLSPLGDEYNGHYVQGINITRNLDKSVSNLRFQQTNTIVINGITFSEKESIYDTTPVLDGPSVSSDTDYAPLLIEVGEFSYSGNKVRLDNYETTNAAEPQSAQLRSWSLTFTDFLESGIFIGISGNIPLEEEYAYPIKHISDITYSYQVQTNTDVSYYTGAYNSLTDKSYPFSLLDASQDGLGDAGAGPNYIVTRTIGATATFPGTLTNAREAVYALYYLDKSILYARDDYIPINRLAHQQSHIDNPQQEYYQRSSIEEIDHAAMSYSVTDTFEFYTHGSGKFREDYNITYESDNRSEGSFGTVSIAGNIIANNTDEFLLGYETTNFTQIDNPEITRHANIQRGWQLLIAEKLTRLDSIPGAKYNPIPKNQNLSFNQDGSLSYSFTYDRRPALLVSGVITEDLSVEETPFNRVQQLIPIYGGRYVKHDFGTYTLPSRTVNYSCRFPQGAYIPGKTAAQIKNIMEAFDPEKLEVQFPNPAQKITSYLIDDSSTSDLKNNTYTYRKTWVYTID